MQQQINLYQSSTAENSKLGWTSWHSSMKIIVIFLGLLFLTNIWQIYGKISYGYEISNLAEKKQQLTKKLVKLSGQVPEEDKIARIEKKLRSLRKENIDKKNILSTLVKLQFKEQTGYSPYLHALAQQKLPGVQITSFKFGAGGSNISINGLVKRAELVLQLLQKLGEESIFSKKIFESFSLSAEEIPGIMKFSLQTK